MSKPDFSELEPEFGEVMDLLSSGIDPMPTEKPSEDVWSAIVDGLSDEVSSDVGSRESADGADTADSPDAEPGLEPGFDPADPTSDRAESASDAAVVSLEARRWSRKRFAVFTAVAAAVLLVAIPIALAVGGSSPEFTAELAALGGFDGEGRAELTDRTLEVDLEGLTAPDGSFYELWLLDLTGGELQDLRSLGRVSADGSFVIPADVDLDQFSVVDVSIEPDDGNPDHSGDSVLRGDLEPS